MFTWLKVFLFLFSPLAHFTFCISILHSLVLPYPSPVIWLLLNICCSHISGCHFKLRSSIRENFDCSKQYLSCLEDCAPLNQNSQLETLFLVFSLVPLISSHSTSFFSFLLPVFYLFVCIFFTCSTVSWSYSLYCHENVQMNLLRGNLHAWRCKKKEPLEIPLPLPRLASCTFIVYDRTKAQYSHPSAYFQNA